MLESRRLLTTTAPHAAWVLDQPQRHPAVRLDLGGRPAADVLSYQWRGLALATGRTTPGPGGATGGFDAVRTLVRTEDADGTEDGEPVALHFGAVSPSGHTLMPPDGNYEFSMPADAFSPALASGLFQTDFFLNADFDHNRAVDFDDLLVLAQRYDDTAGAPPTNSFATGDTNNDGLVNFDDLLKLTQTYNKRIAPAPAYAGQVTLDSLPVDGTLSPIVVNWKGMDDPLAGIDEFGHAFPAREIQGYTVYRGVNSYSFGTVVGSVVRNDALGVGALANYSVRDDTASDGQKYYYRIRPYFNVTRPDGTAGVEHLATTNSASRVAAMKAPTDLTAHADSATGLRLTWLDHSGREGGYKVFAVDRHGAATLLQTLPPDSQEATITGLAASTAHTFRVLAYNANIDALPIQVTASPQVSATASNVTDGITVAWAAPAVDPAAEPPVVSYGVWRKGPGDADFRFVREVPLHVTSLLDAGVSLQRGLTYEYKVEARTEYAPAATLGTREVDYAPRPTVAYTSMGLTISWPADQTPPATLEVTLTDPAGVVTTRTVPLSPSGSGGSVGSGDFAVTDLMPDTAYDVLFRDPPQGPGQTGANASDAPLRVRTRVFKDFVEAYTYNTFTPDSWSYTPNVIEDGVTAAYEPYDEYNDDPSLPAPVPEGEALTLTLSNLPEHGYVRAVGQLMLTPRHRVDGDPEPTPKDELQPTLSITLAGETITATPTPDPAPQGQAWGTAFRIAGDEWAAHSGASATFSFIGNSMPGWELTLLTLVVQVGTPTVSVLGNAAILEDLHGRNDDGSGILGFRYLRGNGVGIDDPLPVSIEWTGSASQGTDFAAPTSVTIPAGPDDEDNPLFVWVDPTPDDEIEADEWFDGVFTSSPLIPKVQKPVAKGEILDNEVFLLLVSGKNQNGAEDDTDHPLGLASTPDMPSYNSGIASLSRELQERINNFKASEIFAHSSDADTDGDIQTSAYSDSRNRALYDIEQKLWKINRDTRPTLTPRTLRMGMAGYSWGAGMIQEVIAAMQEVVATPTGTRHLFPYQNFTLDLVVYIDGVNHGWFTAEGTYPAGAEEMINLYQSQGDFGLSGFMNGGAVAGGTNYDLDEGDDLLLIDPSSSPADNQFRHNGDDYDLDSRVIDKDMWVIKFIAKAFKRKFGR